MSQIKELTKATFQSEIMGKSTLSVIDFWAAWCGPCQMLSPIVDQVSQKYEDVDFYKVNIDEEQELAMQFNVQSIPTLAFIKDGKTVDLSVGLISAEQLEKLLEQAKA